MDSDISDISDYEVKSSLRLEEAQTLCVQMTYQLNVFIMVTEMWCTVVWDHVKQSVGSWLFFARIEKRENSAIIPKSGKDSYNECNAYTLRLKKTFPTFLAVTWTNIFQFE